MYQPPIPAQLVAASPLPEEFIAGHVGRLACLNASGSIEHFIRRLTARSPEQSISFSPLEIFQRAALLSGMEANTYLARHTLCPIEHLCAPTPERAESYMHESHLRQRTALLRLQQPAGLCPACVEEDTATYGFSYWRRTHQIRGLDWCPLHEQPIRRVTKAIPYSACPGYWLRQPDCLGQAPTPYSTDPVVRAYASIALWILATGKRTTKARVGALLTQGVENHQLRSRMPGKGSRISDQAREKTPYTWLKLYFPKIADGAPYIYCPAIDAALFGTSCSPYSIILALSALDLTDKELLSRMLHGQQHTPRVREQKDIELRDRAFAVYIRSEGSYKKAMQLMAATRLATFNLYRKIGLPSLTRADPDAAFQILSFLQSASGEERDIWMSKMASLMKGEFRHSRRWIREVPLHLLPAQFRA